MNKKISNIVVYYTSNNKKEIKARACIFYKDGTVEDVNKEEAKKALYSFVKQEKIKSFEELDKYEVIHYLTKDEFKKRFDEFKAVPTTFEQNKEDNKSSETDSPQVLNLKTVFNDEEKIDENKKSTEKQNKSNNKEENIYLEEIDDDFDQREIGILGLLVNKIKDKKKNKKVDNVKEKKENSKHKKSNIFKRLKTKTAAIITAGALLVTSCIGASCAIYKKFKAEKVSNKLYKSSNIDSNSIATDNLTDKDLQRLASKNYNFAELRQITTNRMQLREMDKVALFLDLFNGGFANKVKDEHSNIRPALKWNEVMALNLAYNNLSKEELQAIFNGSTIDVDNYDGYYKNATLQLMAAFIMEEKDTPINLDQIINSEKGKAFYNKYNNLFLEMKNAKGQELKELSNKFNNELKKDFPITKKVREKGISHGDTRNEIKSYKLAVTPIVAAANMLLDKEYSLSNEVIDYFNDNGLCNRAKDNFEQARLATYNNEVDITNPLYKAYQKAKINELKEHNWYNIKDRERELSKLSKFKEEVNIEFVFDEENNFTGEYSYNKSSNKISKTVTTYKHKKIKIKTSSKKEAKEKAGAKSVKNAENKVKKQIAKDNAENKKKGEAAAKKNQQEMQKEADKNAEKVKQEVENSNKDMNDKINNSNNQIDNNNKDKDTSNDRPVNEDDFGDHNVDFDKDHSDSEGNLDDSIKDITTDKDGAYEDFPDPNESGAKFDAKAKTITKEELASQIVEYMATYPTDAYENTTSYTYTK